MRVLALLVLSAYVGLTANPDCGCIAKHKDFLGENKNDITRKYGSAEDDCESAEVLKTMDKSVLILNQNDCDAADACQVTGPPSDTDPKVVCVRAYATIRLYKNSCFSKTGTWKRFADTYEKFRYKCDDCDVDPPYVAEAGKCDATVVEACDHASHSLELQHLLDNCITDAAACNPVGLGDDKKDSVCTAKIKRVAAFVNGCGMEKNYANFDAQWVLFTKATSATCQADTYCNKKEGVVDIKCESVANLKWGGIVANKAKDDDGGAAKKDGTAALADDVPIGLIIGICVGSVALIAIIVGVICYCKKKDSLGSALGDSGEENSFTPGGKQISMSDDEQNAQTPIVVSDDTRKKMDGAWEKNDSDNITLDDDSRAVRIMEPTPQEGVAGETRENTE